MKVLENTPAVLSLGKLCDENGYQGGFSATGLLDRDQEEFVAVFGFFG